MAEMSPIDVLRRYQEYETELAPLLLGLLTLPEASLKTYAFVEEVKSLAPQIRPAILAPVPAAQGQLRLLVQGHGRELEINLHQLIAWLMGTGSGGAPFPGSGPSTSS